RPGAAALAGARRTAPLVRAERQAPLPSGPGQRVLLPGNAWDVGALARYLAEPPRPGDRLDRPRPRRGGPASARRARTARGRAAVGAGTVRERAHRGARRGTRRTRFAQPLRERPAGQLIASRLSSAA